MIQIHQILISAALIGALPAYSATVSFQNVKLSENDTVQTISGVLAKPPSEGPFPAVVILHSCGGPSRVTNEDWPNYLTGLGYVTLSIDSFGPRGIRRCPTRLPREEMELTQDAYGALEYLATLAFIDKGRLGVMGFSLGGNTINYFVGQPIKTPSGLNYKVAVSLYGRCSNLAKQSKTIPTAVIIGARENSDRLNPCKTLAENPLPSIKVHVLPDTYHSFDNPRYTTITNDSNGNPQLYNREATNKAREITKDFLAQHLGR